MKRRCGVPAHPALLAPALFPLVLAGWLMACAPAPAPPEPPGFAELDTAVQQQYRTRRAAFDASSQADIGLKYGELGIWYHAYAFWPEAERAYQQAQRRLPNQAAWPYYRAQVARAEGRLEDSRRLFALVLEASPPRSVRVPARVWSGEIALLEARFEDAERHFRAALEDRPRCASAWFGIARLALARRHFAQARMALERVQALQPGVDAVLYARARALRGLGDEAAARAVLGELAKSNSEQRQLRLDDPLMHAVETLRAGVLDHIQAGRRARWDGAPGRAIALFKQAIAADDHNVEARIELGRTLAEVGRVRSGIRELMAARVLFPEHSRLARELGRLLVRAGDLAAAEQALAASVALDGRDAASRFDLAQVERRRG